ncbi:PH domain protein [Talaromyces proteolyticus]|uniref:PH domain protein n=1 Tax=Talaromyces proteolyticus TaxID=1131652 RepID=A0AAD4PYT4_9EURO|nr:PH domain protein [Talaromyces proteolyticus]KAH8701870.1 PH domain protein [Talaromyces proteolyticus]
MATAQSPSQDGYDHIPMPNDPSQLSRMGSGSRPNSYVANSIVPTEFAVSQPAHLPDQSPLGYTSRFNEDMDISRRGSAVVDGFAGVGGSSLQRSDSQMSHNSVLPSRGGTLKKKPSLSRKGSLKRSGSRRSLRAGSVRSLNLGEKEKYGGDDPSSAFYVPIPTTGSPTDELAHRFQSWRKVLKDLIVFFKEIQKSYETRAKLLLSAGNVINNMSIPSTFLESGGLADATEVLRDYHKQGLAEANKAREVESEVILQLTGLRSDLQQKTKEIKSLSGDFKNSVDKEVESTRKAVRNLQETLGLVDVDPSATSGKHDPFILRLQVDRQLERQIEEENYLHRAYLNLENSGRELESIVVGEIQKAYNAYASILKREADEAYDTVEKLRAGPISMPKDHEWNNFISESEQLVDPRVPVRNVEAISYPGKDHPAAAEVRSGMLERKSKYLKSYTPGWYVLSATHLHEFKSADRIASQTPVMSLYLPEQKLGSHSQPESTSHKFMLKGRQTGAMHRGHAWVFRAESYDTMMAWFDDITNLSARTGEARNAFVRRHVRSLSGNSFRASSISSDGVMDEDEADQTPYSSQSAVLQRATSTAAVTPDKRPQPGGRFPSDVQIDRNLQATLSRSSGESSGDREALAGASALPDSGIPFAPTQQPAEDPNYPAAQEHTQLPHRPVNYQNAAPPENYDSYAGEWVNTSTTIDHAHNHKQEQSPTTSRRAFSPSQAPIVVNNEAHPQNNYVDNDSAELANTNSTNPSAATTSIYAVPDASLLNRQESERSRQTHSTYSLTASTPTSITSPLSDSAVMDASSTRPNAQSKESASTIDQLKMPGKFPRTLTG